MASAGWCGHSNALDLAHLVTRQAFLALGDGFSETRGVCKGQTVEYRKENKSQKKTGFEIPAAGGLGRGRSRRLDGSGHKGIVNGILPCIKSSCYT